MADLSPHDTDQPRVSVGREPITVVYGVDGRFALPLAVSIQSALDNVNRDVQLDIYVIDGGVRGRDRQRIESSIRGRHCRLFWLRPSDAKLSQLKVGGAITVATYYRLLIPGLLLGFTRRFISTQT